jgi:hypothetical protein
LSALAAMVVVRNKRGENIVYLNAAILELELEHKRQQMVREAMYRQARGELVRASGRTWREARPFRALFHRERPLHGPEV